jgi:ribose 5-phosphate isomerase B
VTEMSKKIVIASDHRGFAMKEWLKEHVAIPSCQLSWLDVGTYTTQRTDYPTYALLAVKALQEGKAACGILLCGTGVGMSIVANRFPRIYAALAWNKDIAKESKEDDNANVLVLPAEYISNEQAAEMIHVWLYAEFKNGRYRYRIDMIDALQVR